MASTTLKLRLTTRDLHVWKHGAKNAGISLSEWIRRKCKGEPIFMKGDSRGSLPAEQESRSQFPKASRTLGTGRSRGGSKDRAVATASPQVASGDPPAKATLLRHTAESNWHTCLCSSCSKKRKELDLAVGEVPVKKGKR